jgi:outer membrane protein assembly factor BamB
VLALSKNDKAMQVAQRLASDISAPPGQAGTNLYVPLGDGTLAAVDGTVGDKVGGAGFLWRAQIGGIMSRPPVITAESVYAAGDNSGVARIDRTNGELIWRSDAQLDRVVGANQEFVYVRDRQGRLHIFNARRATDTVNRRSSPLASVDLGEFNVPVTNTITDRVFLVADNGLIVCLRDASAKYARPVRIAPELAVNPPVKEAVNPAPMVPMVPMKN